MDHIDSVEQLEVLLLLQRSAVDWTSHAVAAELRIDPASAQRRLEALATASFAEADGASFRYRRGGPYDAAVRQLARVYTERRVSVITLIFTKPVRPENDPVRALAEAFRLRGRNKPGG